MRKSTIPSPDKWTNRFQKGKDAPLGLSLCSISVVKDCPKSALKVNFTGGCAEEWRANTHWVTESPPAGTALAEQTKESTAMSMIKRHRACKIRISSDMPSSCSSSTSNPSPSLAKEPNKHPQILIPTSGAKTKVGKLTCCNRQRLNIAAGRSPSYCKACSQRTTSPGSASRASGREGGSKARTGAEQDEAGSCRKGHFSWSWRNAKKVW